MLLQEPLVGEKAIDVLPLKVVGDLVRAEMEALGGTRRCLPYDDVDGEVDSGAETDTFRGVIRTPPW